MGFFHWSFDLHRFFDKTLPSCLDDRVRGLHSLAVNLPPTFSQIKVSMTRKLLFRVLFIEPFHMTSQRPFWCSKTKKRWPCWCTKLNPWALSFIFVQIFSFCGVKLTWPLVTWENALNVCVINSLRIEKSRKTLKRAKQELKYTDRTDCKSCTC